MTFKDLENWQKELVVKNLKDGENIYIEYTKDDIIAGLKKENQELKNQQKEFIEYLDNLNIFGTITVREVIDKYKEIIGSDNK